MEKLIVWVVLLIALAIFYAIRNSYYKSKLPDEEELNRYVKEIKQMKLNSDSYQKRLQFLREKGLPKKIAERLIAYSEEE